MDFRKLFIIIGFFCHTFLYGEDYFKIKDSLKECSHDGLCSSMESILFFPIFPWVTYLNDKQAHPAQIKRFNSFNYEFDASMTKLNNNYSGYIIDLNFLYKNIGFKVAYDTFFDGFNDNRHIRGALIFSLSPMLHIQPMFELGWRYLETDTYLKNGPEISFFNYKIMFNRKFHFKLANYMFFIDSKICYENILGAEYYLYPTISFKMGINIKYVLEEMFYGIQTGFSLKLI